MQPEAQKYVIFSIRDELFGAPASQVLEVAPAPRREFAGLWHTHGKLVPLLGLEAALGFEHPRTESCDGVALLCRSTAGPGTVAFVGGELKSVRPLLEASIDRAVAVETRLDRHCLLGIARDGEDLIQLIDLTALASALTTTQGRAA